jgi:hypothetical protein
MTQMYKVECDKHNYHTALDMTLGTAIRAAEMHSLLPCNDVKVLDSEGVQYQTRNREKKKDDDDDTEDYARSAYVNGY